MKIYVAARFKGAENQKEIELLCEAVRRAGIEDFCFARDIEGYRKTFDSQKEIWDRTLEEIKKCDGFLIDVSDKPTGGRVVEAGIAYALSIPIFVLVHKNTPYKELFNGIAATVIHYEDISDITVALKAQCT